MKKTILILLTMLYALNIAAQGLNGSGTNDDPYLINTVEELKWMSGQVNNKVEGYASASYKLMADLDFSSEGDWVPIGTNSSTPFGGDFDGNCKVIKNITIGSNENSANIEYAGFFGYTRNDYISNLEVELDGLFSCTHSRSYAGRITTYALCGIIINCVITSTNS